MTPRALLICLSLIFTVAAGVALWAMGVGRLEVDIDLIPAPAASVGPHGLEDVIVGVVATFIVLLVGIGGVGALAWWAWRAVVARGRRPGPWS